MFRCKEHSQENERGLFDVRWFGHVKRRNNDHI